MARWIRFLFAILCGLGLGLAYGWFMSPLRSAESSPETLRIDYKTDYVLMVAETFQYEHDPQMAAQRLSALGEPQTNALLEQAIQFAQKAGYTEPDIACMQTLLSALEGTLPTGGMPTP
jgi:hypothetical protein